RIENLLDRTVEPVDLVHEEDVVALEPGEDRGHVAFALERGAGDAADADTELLTNDVRQARLAQSRRTDEQDMVERFLTRFRRGERNRKLVLDALLADELGQPARAQRFLEDFLLGDDRRREKLSRHVRQLSTPGVRVPPATAPDRRRQAPVPPRRRSSPAPSAHPSRRGAAACRRP